MVASHLVWLLRTRKIRKIAKAAGQAFDDNKECQEWQSKGITFFAKKKMMIEQSGYGGCEHVVPKTVPNAVV